MEERKEKKKVNRRGKPSGKGGSHSTGLKVTGGEPAPRKKSVIRLECGGVQLVKEPESYKKTLEKRGAGITPLNDVKGWGVSGDKTERVE